MIVYLPRGPTYSQNFFKCALNIKYPFPAMENLYAFRSLSVISEAYVAYACINIGYMCAVVGINFQTITQSMKSSKCSTVYLTEFHILFVICIMSVVAIVNGRIILTLRNGWKWVLTVACTSDEKSANSGNLPCTGCTAPAPRKKFGVMLWGCTAFNGVVGTLAFVNYSINGSKYTDRLH